LAARKRASGKKRERKLWLITAAVLLPVIVFINFGDLADDFQDVWIQRRLPDPSVMRVTMIDVGQGDSIWLTSGGESVLVDAGENYYGSHVARYLKRNGVKSLAAVIGTHPHSDHIGGIDNVLDAMPVDTLYMPDADSGMAFFSDVMDAAADAYVDVVIPEAGQQIRVGDMEITFLHPDAGDVFEDLNNYSICILVEHPYGSIILTGDAESDAELRMLDTGLIKDVDVLKVGHHGSVSSTSDPFLAAISPEFALISCGAGNDYGHPHRETLGKLSDGNINVFRTDRDGAIAVDFTEGGITITTG